MGFFVILLIVATLLAVIIPIAISQAKRADEAWSRAADKLSLRFRPGGLLGSRQLDGELDGYKILVDTYVVRRGKHNQTYTRFRVRYPSLGLGLKLQNAGFFSGVTKLFGAQDIEVGEAGFDHAMVIKGRRPERVKEYLTSARRMRIHRFFLKYRGATIDDREVLWSTSGVIRDGNRLVRVIRVMVNLASELSHVPKPSEMTLQNALDEQDRGRSEEALKLLREHSQQEVAGDPEIGTEERLIEGELLYLADRGEEAQEVFAEAHAQDPEDVEVEQWYRGLRGELEDDSTSSRSDPDDGGLDAASVCRTLFESGATSYRVTRLFEEKYSGKAVNWSGIVERVEPYSYDLVFGNGPGCRVIVTVHRLASSVYGDQVVSAVVQLPHESLEQLRGSEGEPFSFAGTLVKVDGLMRKIYVGSEATG